MAAAMVQMSCLYRGMLLVRTTGSRPLIPGLLPTHFRAFSLKKEPELNENPFYQKYEEKIKNFRNAKPEEYKTRVEKRHEGRNELGHSKQAEFVKLMEQELENRNKQAVRPVGFTKDKTLGSILNLDKIQNNSGAEIGELWMTYYASKDTISAVIPAHVFEVLSKRAKSCPSFLYALPQKEGYEFFLGQWAGQMIHFTSLINVQTMGEHAPSQLILYHYSELQEDKGIVLMTAEMDTKFVTVHQAQCLANQVQFFYASQQQEIVGLVENFNHKPADFNYMAMIAELEQGGISPVVTIGSAETTNGN